MWSTVLEILALYFACGFLTVGLAWNASVKAVHVFVSLAREDKGHDVLTRGAMRDMAFALLIIIQVFLWPWSLLTRIGNGHWYSGRIRNHDDYANPQ